MLDTATEEAARLTDYVEKVAPALKQIAALGEAIEIAAEQVGRNKRLLGLRLRVEQSAKALGVQPPALPPEAARRLHEALVKCAMQPVSNASGGHTTHAILGCHFLNLLYGRRQTIYR